jgi:hypothetical protein
MRTTRPNITIEYALDEENEVTSSAFLVTALQWAHQHGVWEPFTRLLDLKMKTVQYTPLQKVQTLLASILIGCQYNADINARLVPDTIAANLLGMARFPDQSQCNLVLRRFDATNIDQLECIHAEHLARFACFPQAHWRGYVLIDIDQCGLVANGKTYEFARKGYFPHQHHCQGYQLSAAWLGGCGLTLGLRFDPGNVHCSTRLRELVELAAARCGESYRQAIYRVDCGYGSQLNIRWFQNTGRLFVAKALLRRPDKWATKVAPNAWRLVSRAPGVRVAEIDGGPGVRAIVCEVTTPKHGIQYSVLLTNLPMEVDAAALWHLYAGRQTIEAFFKTARHVYGMGNLRSRQFTAIHAFLWLIFLTHNLLQWIKTGLFADTPVATMGTRELVERVGRIPARREQTGTGWRLLLPSLDRLAQLFVAVFHPQWVQLSLRL